MLRSKLATLLCCSVCSLLLLTTSCADEPSIEKIAEPATADSAPGKSGGKTNTAMTTKASPSSQTPRVYMISPQDGDVVPSNFKVVFGLSSMGVAPAGTVKEGTGHHHLLIDVDEMPPMNLPLPSTDNIRHFGGGQTETWIKLSPGKHKLQLLLGDFAHIPHATPLLSEPISVTVSDGS